MIMMIIMMGYSVNERLPGGRSAGSEGKGKAREG
jgi:hypothetical protein